MVKISDIFKNKPQPPEEPTPKKEKEIKGAEPQKSTTPPQPSPLQFAQVMKQKEPGQDLTQQPPRMQVAGAIKELKSDDAARSGNSYSKSVQLNKEFLKNIAQGQPADLKPVKDLIQEIVDSFVLGDKALFPLFYSDYAPEDYLSHHMVNVMVMSIAVGLKLGYNKSRLNDLGIAAFLHDIGMLEFKEVFSKPRKLSEEEYSQIKRHPAYSAQILSKINGLSEAIINAVREQHERVDGTGYPRGLKDADISEFGRLIATVDTYEALVHQRAYRKQVSPYEAIKTMLSCGASLFETRIFKVMIDLIGVYPIGSYAELNTSEIVRIASPNSDFPLRPVVNIIFDANKNRLDEPRSVDLARQFNLYIKKPLSDEDVTRLIKG